MNALLLSIGSFLVLLLSALAAAPYVVDWNDYRHVFETQLTNLLGREIHVGGDVNLRLLPSPYVRFEQVSLSGREKNLERPLLKAKSITLWLAVPPLLRGAVEATEMEVTEPHIIMSILEDGEGNWTSLGASKEARQFIPEHVALETVQIRNGTVEFAHQPGVRPFVFEYINGTLSAQTLQGPYKFSGRFSYGSLRRDIRFSTSKHVAGRSMRLKSVLRILETGTTYSLDGQLDDLGKQPKLAASLIMRIPKDAKAASEARPLPSEGANFQLLSDGQAIEVRSSVTANLDRAVFSDVKILLASQGQPQSIGGEATVDWKDGLNLNDRLGSKWLDADRLLTQDISKKISVRDAFARLSGILKSHQSRFNRAAINIKVAQAVLDGESIKALDLHIEKDGNGLSISKLTVELPGATKLHLSGRLYLDGEQRGFTGPVNVKGRDLYRFARWALGGGTEKVAPRNDHYSVQARVAFAPGVIKVEDAQGELAGSAFSGNFRYRFDDRREFVLELDGNRFDLGLISGGQVSLKSLASTLWLGRGGAAVEDGTAGAGSKSFAEFLQTATGHIKVRVGHLISPELEARDVDVRARLVDGTLEIESLSLDTEDGVSIRGEGRIEKLGKAADGKVQLIVASEGPAGLQTLGRLLSLPKTVIENESLLKALSPLRVAVALETGLAGNNVTRILIDGAAAGSHLSIKAQHEGDLSRIGSEPVEISASLTNPNGETLVKQVFWRARSMRFAGSGDGVLALHAIGIPSEGLNTLLELEAAGLRGGFEGDIKIADGKSTLDGVVGLTAERASAGLAIFGVDGYPDSDRQQFSLRAKVAKSSAKYRFDEVTVRIGATVAKGHATLDADRSPAQFDVSINANRVYLPHLMSLLLRDELPAIVAAAKKAVGTPESDFWPERIFDRDMFSRIEGRLKLTAKMLDITGQLALSDGSLTVEQSGGILKISSLTGRLFGGALSATGQFTPSRSGVGFEGTGRLTNAVLGALAKTGQAQPLAVGQANLDLSLKGHGRSPRGLVAVLSGKGTISLGDGQILSLSPAALPKMAKQTAKADDDGFTQRLKATLDSGAFPYKAFNIPINIAHGTLNITDVALKSGKTTLKINTLIDLVRLKLDGSITLSTKSPDSKQDLPPVTIAFTGPLSDLGQLAPAIDAKSLKRYLTVRRIEKDVEQLERLELEERSSSLGAPGRPVGVPAGAGATAVQGAVSRGPGATNSIAPADALAPPPRASSPLLSSPSAPPVAIPVRPSQPNRAAVSDTAWTAVPERADGLSSSSAVETGPVSELPVADRPPVHVRRRTESRVRKLPSDISWDNLDNPLTSD
ncbi:hypothetical protein MnTg02_00910 [bacterium MnTg02]|nr:hypothetical protein MnTg02_00910 [bacterium MnTg02]